MKKRIRSTFSRTSSNDQSLCSNSEQQIAAESLLQEMVDVDSLTNDAQGVDRVQAVVSRELESMGFKTALISNPDSSVLSGDLLLATLEGERPEFITFVSHADVVMGKQAVGSYRKLPDGQHARGPGVIDNKGGLVVALEGLRRYLKKLNETGQRPAHSLRFVSSPNEESGSPGFQDLFRQCAADSKLILGFEPALDDGSIIESRRGNRWYEVTIKGQEAHAGRCKGEQINAAHELAIKISKLHKLSQPKKGLSVNVGHISGGRGRFNIVCGEASAKIDTRFSSFESREKLHRRILKILDKSFVASPISGKKSEMTYSIADDCPPFSATTDSRSLLKSYLRAVYRSEGRTIVARKAGGAGDVNYMSREGVIVLDGLGPCGGKMHTEEEFIFLPSLTTRSTALAEFLMNSHRELTKKNLEKNVTKDFATV